MSGQNKAYSKTTVALTQFSMLLAIEFIFCFTPLGSIPIGPIVATTAGIPLVVAGIMMGVKSGALMGLAAGIFSLIIWTFMPPAASAALAFMYSPFYSLGDVHGNGWSLFISVFPRVMVGVVAGLSFNALNKLSDSRVKVLPYAVGGALGSLANTFFTLTTIYLAFAEDFVRVTGGNLAEAKSIVWNLVVTLFVSNGLIEAALCALAAVFVCQPLMLYFKAKGQ